MGKLSVTETLEANLVDWRLLRNQLHARFLTGDFKTGAAFVAAITDAAEAAGHHPDVTLTYPWVDLRLTSHDVNAITDRDVALAKQISAIAEEHEIAAETKNLVEVDLALDSAQISETGAFWAVVLTGSREALTDDEIVDPNGRVPLLWFQQTDAHSEPRQRFHIDLLVGPETLDERINAAIAAGGTLVDDSEKPSFVVLADPEGNKVCLCTCLSRGA